MWVNSVQMGLASWNLKPPTFGLTAIKIEECFLKLSSIDLTIPKE
jgi:hypothetical protein